MVTPIKVYAVNLLQRTERRESIEAQFADKPEFDLHIVPAIERHIGAHGLWQTFYGIVEQEAISKSDYFIFCEDDHIFTDNYSFEVLRERIYEAQTLGADLLSGGMSVLRTPVETAPGLFWVSWFNGMQFTVIFNQCYQKILAAKTSEGYAVDILLSHLAYRKYVIFPYISVQCEFGYSDATDINDEEGRVTRFFNKTQRLLDTLQKVKRHYSAIHPEIIDSIIQTDVSRAYIPTYIINLPERTDRLKHIRAQFSSHPEFDVHIYPAKEHKVGAIGLWQSICDIVRQAKNAEEDFILICEDDHIFTEYYNRETFLRQIMLGAVMGAHMLNGGVGDFSNLVPLPGGIAWMDRFWCTQFIVIYKSAYEIILNVPFGLRDVADEKLSAILTNKFVINPFISEQTDFGYSDITQANNSNGMILRHFANAKHKLKHYTVALSSEQSIAANHAIKEYLLKTEIKSLHLGCGHNVIPDWLNTDIYPTYGALFLDISQPFPIPTNSFDFVFAEHVIDLFDIHRLHVLFGEIYRVLKPGGILRCTFYDTCVLKDLISENPNLNTYSHLNIQTYSPIIDVSDMDEHESFSIALNNLIRKFQTIYVHTLKSVQIVACSVGFAGLTELKVGESPHIKLRNIHSRNFLPLLLQTSESITLEITKP